MTSGWVLEATDHLRTANWAVVTNSPVILDGASTVVLDPNEVTKFYRMRRLP